MLKMIDKSVCDQFVEDGRSRMKAGRFIRQKFRQR
jgi:hypothetical protein